MGMIAQLVLPSAKRLNWIEDYYECMDSGVGMNSGGTDFTCI